MKILVVVALFVINIMVNQIPINANNSESVSYSVHANLPENQINSEVTYFDIAMELGQEQELEVEITNTSDKEIKVFVEANTAATNSNGVITYDGSITDYHDSMTHPFHEIARPKEDIVTVPANSSETATIQVKAPNETFDGEILGGLYFKLINNEDEASKGVSVQNEYAYVIGVNIVQAGNTTTVTPELELESVNPELINYRTGLQTTFNNTTPTVISDLTFTGHIYRVDNLETPLYSRKMENFSIAPNNKFNFPVTFDNQSLEPGDYLFRATASNEDHNFEFEETFTIAKEVAEEINNEAVEIAEPVEVAEVASSSNSTLIYILVAVVAVLLVVIVWLMNRMKSK